MQSGKYCSPPGNSRTQTNPLDPSREHVFTALESIGDFCALQLTPWPTTLWLSCCCFHFVIVPLNS
ncbi:unnamed protein product [Staurois parvus]|uniref:Uncharacterized protein n=1 Tax=Staurois parvus TaxID=386267 RepID=A0ABN9D703_9NEOB|nr:unnamed protein product [Staurois parvus]